MRARRSSHVLLATALLVVAALLVAALPSTARADTVRVATVRAGDDAQALRLQIQVRDEARRLLQIREDRGDADGARVVLRQASAYRLLLQVQRDLQVLRRLHPRIDLPDVRERWP